MTEEEVRGLFTLAGFDILRIMRLPNGYFGGNLDSLAADVEMPRIYEEGKTMLSYPALQFLNSAVYSAMRPWWFVKTKFGWIEIGWRKRVIQIDWTDVGGPHDVTNDDVTKHGTLVHAWSIPKALEYLTALKEKLAA